MYIWMCRRPKEYKTIKILKHCPSKQSVFNILTMEEMIISASQESFHINSVSPQNCMAGKVSFFSQFPKEKGGKRELVSASSSLATEEMIVSAQRKEI